MGWVVAGNLQGPQGEPGPRGPMGVVESAGLKSEVIDLTSKLRAGSTPGAVKLYVIGTTATLSITGTTFSTSNGWAIAGGSIPNSYRPKENVVSSLTGVADRSKYGSLEVRADGGVNILTTDAGVSYSGSVSWPVRGAVAPGVPSLPLVGPGIDPTGKTDSTEAVRKTIAELPEGATLTIPAESIIQLTDQVEVKTPGVTITGTGTLRWTAGIADKPALKISAPGVSIENITLENPNKLGNKQWTGDRNIAIEFRESEGSVQNCHINSFVNGIVVVPANDKGSEIANFRFIGNRIKDILGVGAGPTGTEGAEQSQRAEATGDGITCWGAQVTIVGNVVNAAEGADARVGIHVEGLKEFQRAEPETPYPDAMATITGNVVYGPFRRGIVDELVNNAVITGNTVAGATWWSVQATGGDHIVVSDNTVIWDRKPTDKQGQNWGPHRAPLAVTAGASGTIMANNTVRMVAGSAADSALVIDAFSEKPVRDSVVSGNVVRVDPGATCGAGVQFLESAGAHDVTIQGNVFTGLKDVGVFAPHNKLSGLNILDNTFTAASNQNDSRGVQLSDVTQPTTRVEGNTFIGFKQGLRLANSKNLIVSRNLFKDCLESGDFWGITGMVYSGNTFTGTPKAETHLNKDVNVIMLTTRIAGDKATADDKGPAPVGVSGVKMEQNGDLVFTFTDGKTVNVGSAALRIDTTANQPLAAPARAKTLRLLNAKVVNGRFSLAGAYGTNWLGVNGEANEIALPEGRKVRVRVQNGTSSVISAVGWALNGNGGFVNITEILPGDYEFVVTSKPGRSLWFESDPKLAGDVIITIIDEAAA